MKKFGLKTKLVAFLSVALALISCGNNDDEITLISGIEITVSLPEADFKNTAFIGKEIEMVGDYTYKATTNESGVATFNGVIPGVYNISVTETLAEEDYDNLVNPPLENKKIVVNGVLANIQAYNSLKAELSLNMSFERDLLISKVYYSGTKDDNAKNYSVDNYIEIYNNSDEVVDVKNLYVGVTETYSTNPFYEFRNEYLGLADVFRVKDTTLNPGASIVIARQAIDHTEFAANSVDLSGADYETKASKNQIYNDAVQGIESVYRTFATRDYLFFNKSGNNAIIIFNYDGADINDLGLLGDETITRGQYFIKVTPDMILDGVECVKFNDELIDISDKRLADGIDATYITTSTTSGGINEIVERRVDSYDGDRAILVDTNNSLNDFVVTSNPESRNYSKPELQPQQ